MAECSVVLGANDLTKITRVVFVTFDALLGNVATFGNLLIVIVLLYHKNLRRRSNFLILCLSLSDLAVGILLQPMTLAQLFDAPTGQNCPMAYATTYIGTMLCGASSWVLALMSYDRYLHLVKLQNYNVHKTKMKLYTMLS